MAYELVEHIAEKAAGATVGLLEARAFGDADELVENLDGRVHPPDRLVRRRHGSARLALAGRVALRFARLVVHSQEL